MAKYKIVLFSGLDGRVSSHRQSVLQEATTQDDAAAGDRLPEVERFTPPLSTKAFQVCGHLYTGNATKKQGRRS